MDRRTSTDSPLPKRSANRNRLSSFFSSGEKTDKKSDKNTKKSDDANSTVKVKSRNKSDRFSLSKKNSGLADRMNDGVETPRKSQISVESAQLISSEDEILQDLFMAVSNAFTNMENLTVHYFLDPFQLAKASCKIQRLQQEYPDGRDLGDLSRRIDKIIEPFHKEILSAYLQLSALYGATRAYSALVESLREITHITGRLKIVAELTDFKTPMTRLVPLTSESKPVVTGEVHITSRTPAVRNPGSKSKSGKEGHKKRDGTKSTVDVKTRKKRESFSVFKKNNEAAGHAKPRAASTYKSQAQSEPVQEISTANEIRQDYELAIDMVLTKIAASDFSARYEDTMEMVKSSMQPCDKPHSNAGDFAERSGIIGNAMQVLKNEIRTVRISLLTSKNTVSDAAKALEMGELLDEINRITGRLRVSALLTHFNTPMTRLVPRSAGIKPGVTGGVRLAGKSPEELGNTPLRPQPQPAAHGPRSARSTPIASQTTGATGSGRPEHDAFRTMNAGRTDSVKSNDNFSYQSSARSVFDDLIDDLSSARSLFDDLSGYSSRDSTSSDDWGRFTGFSGTRNFPDSDVSSDYSGPRVEEIISPDFDVRDYSGPRVEEIITDEEAASDSASFDTSILSTQKNAIVVQPYPVELNQRKQI